MTVAIEQAREADWAIYKAIRLQALQSDPHVFGSNYMREADLPDEQWHERLRDPDRAVFFLKDDDRVVGITGIAIDENDDIGKHARLWGSWLAPDYRGKGFSRLLYDARLDWARRHPSCRTVIVSHRASNAASKAANQKHGFVFTHATPHIWPDGVEDDHLYYRLDLENKSPP